MEGQSAAKSCCPSSGPCGVPANSKAYCKCGEGWCCVITKLDSTESDTPFYKCNEGGCVCITDDGSSAAEEAKMKKVVETEGAYCVCGEGYACTITKTKGTDAGKVFCECGNGYTCEVDGETLKATPAQAGCVGCNSTK